MDVSWAGWLLKYLFLEARHVYDECFSGDIKCNGKTKFEPCYKSPICVRIFMGIRKASCYRGVGKRRSTSSICVMVDLFSKSRIFVGFFPL